MLKIYGSDLCPDCRECKANLDAHRVPYEYIDINETLSALKAFLSLRDTDRAFDEAKGRGAIGIPAVVSDNGSVTLDWEKVLTDQGLPIVYRESRGNACSLGAASC